MPLSIVYKEKLEDARVPRIVTDNINLEILNSENMNGDMKNKLREAQLMYFDLIR